MNIELKRFNEVDKSEIIELMNHPLVLKHMPLATGNFGEEDYKKFIVAKDKLWEENGYGPWAFFLNETFIGWGGLQPVDADVEVAIVLHPSYWGMGKKIYETIIKHAFQTLKLQSVIILFPPTRTRIKGILRLGFKKEKEILMEGKSFICYRLCV